jgi:hypothetical protein
MTVKEPSLEEIIKYWGSAEDYREEQRRTGLAALEAKPFGQQGYTKPSSDLYKTTAVSWLKIGRFLIRKSARVVKAFGAGL